MLRRLTPYLRRVPWWGWVIAVLALGAIGGSQPETEEAAESVPPVQTTAPVVPAEPVQPAEAVRSEEPSQATTSYAADILALGSSPTDNAPTESSVEGDRHYYTFDRPDLGESVKSVWISPTNWWVNISGMAFDHQQLGGAQGTTFTEGPLKGLEQKSIIPDKELHIMTQEWAERVWGQP